MKSFVVLSVLVGFGCGDDGGNNTTPIDFSGEYVDWDSSEAQFCGIFQATWTAHDDATVTVATNPNGRVTLTLPGSNRVRVDITPPSGNSECLQLAGQHYAVPGIAIVDDAVADKMGDYSTRAFTTMRQTAFGFDPTKAHVMVHVDGTASSVSLTGSHDQAQAFDGTTWAAGDTGENVYFPNVDPSSGTATVTMANATGNGDVPLEAGTFTYLTILGN